jgi:hypothetical protein
MPAILPKTSPGAQNLKTKPDTLCTAGNDSAQNMKTGPNALGTAKNMSGSAKNENGTRRPRYRQKLAQARKT